MHLFILPSDIFANFWVEFLAELILDIERLVCIFSCDRLDRRWQAITDFVNFSRGPNSAKFALYSDPETWEGDGHIIQEECPVILQIVYLNLTDVSGLWKRCWTSLATTRSRLGTYWRAWQRTCNVAEQIQSLPETFRSAWCIWNHRWSRGIYSPTLHSVMKSWIGGR